MRKEFSRKIRRQAWERANGQCEGTLHRLDHQAGNITYRCTAPIDLGRFEYDHRIPDWMGGDSSLENCEVLCLCCYENRVRGQKRQRVRALAAFTRRRKPGSLPTPADR